MMSGAVLVPDFEGMRRSWRSASPSQKAVRVGLLGSLVGTAIYLYASGRRGTPLEAAAPPRSQTRGSYR